MAQFPPVTEELVQRYDVPAPRYTSYPTAPEWTALDQAAPPAYSEELVAKARDGVLQIVPERGHALLIEDETATIAAIELFLARVADGRQ